VGSRPVPEADRPLAQQAISARLQAREGFLWIGASDGLYRYDGYELRRVLDRRIQALLEDSAEELWVATSKGLFRLDRRTATFEEFQHDPDDPQSLPADVVTALAEALDGRLWFGTQRGGLARFDRKQRTFLRCGDEPEDADNLSSSRPREALLDLNAGAFGEPVSGASGRERRERTPAGKSAFSANCTTPAALWAASPRINTIHEDRQGRLWSGTYNNGLSRLAAGRAGFEHHRHDPDERWSLSDDRVLCLIEDRDGLLWVGTCHGLNALDLSTRQLRHFRHRSDGTGPPVPRLSLARRLASRLRCRSSSS
jgi:ligand-binding sensor domain-containing protein